MERSVFEGNSRRIVSACERAAPPRRLGPPTVFSSVAGYDYAGQDPINRNDLAGTSDVPILPVPLPLQTNPFLVQYTLTERQIRAGDALAITVDVGQGPVRAVAVFYSKTGGYTKQVIAQTICHEDMCFGMISATPGTRTQRLVSIQIYAEGGVQVFNTSIYHPTHL